MNINLDDKKIKKIVYAIDDKSELDIIFENGEIASLNRRFYAAMKMDTFVRSMMDSSKKLGDKISEIKKAQALRKEEQRKKDEDRKSMFNDYQATKKLVDMERDGTLDKIVKDHNLSYEGPIDPYDDENAYDTTEPNEEVKETINKDEKSTEDKCGMGGRKESDTATESGNNAEEADKPQQPDFIKFEELEKKKYEEHEYDADKIEAWFSKIDKDKLRVLFKLGELGFYDLNPKERKVQCNDLIKKAISEVYGERE